MIYTEQDRLRRLEEMRQLAIARGGVCLSKRYSDTKTKLKWKCAVGHEWSAIPSSVLRGSWCEICAKKRVGRQKAHTIEMMHKIAAERDGECLSQIYKNNLTELRWRCKYGHEWEAVPASILRNGSGKGSWCPICVGKLPKDLAFQEFRKLAVSRGGLLLSKRYRNSHSHLLWQCAKGHKWKAVPSAIKNGTWCPVCGGSFLLNISQMRKAANGFGGHCLSKKYVNSKTHLLWRCSEGHEWNAKSDHVLKGHWCPTCSSGISERICRALLERITGVLFPKTRPNWLKNERGRQMELDGYAQSLKLAFEYQGYQHFKPIPFIDSNLEKLKVRQQDDERKRQLCFQHGVTLLEIHYDVSHDKLQKHLIEKLNGLNQKLIIDDSPAKIEQLGVWHRKHLEEMQSIAKARDGKLLSKFYINSQTKLRWRCAEGHSWEAVPNGIKRGSWCGECGDKRAAIKKFAHTIEEMRALAQAKGGECLSSSYKGTDLKLRWRCAKDHEWEARPSGVIKGKWCQKCGYEKAGNSRALKVEEMQQLATKRGGECLSKRKVNGRIKFLWRCAKGHEWEAVSYSIRRGSWCPVCVGKRSA
jgi:hypothetical protein